MRDCQFSRSLRIISTIVLSFFIWSFGGVFEVAYAIKSDQQSALSAQNSKSSTQSSAISRQPKTQKPEEKFQKTIEDIEKTLADTSIDHETKRNRIKGKKTEIEAHDIEIRKQFKETEDKINSLPEVIKQRHRDFVKKYEGNLTTLKTNLDDIDKAKTDAEKLDVSKKAQAFLEKVKAPKRHRKLDPNKLPHRTAEPVFKEPRTKPEEFTEGKELRAQGKELKPILVASNGSLAGLLSPDSKLYAQSSTELALATPPSNDDLAENGVEIMFTPAITAKAAELGNKPLKIYEWVRNNIEFVPTYGSIQGADMCLQTKQCNAFDTSSLLIALLRVSGVYARYAYGTVEIPAEKVKNWVGGFTTAKDATNLLASAGIPTKAMTVGSEIKYVRIETVYVEAFIDYIPSRGARHKVGDTWIPLDASFKQYNYTPGIDIKSAVPFDAQSFINQIQSTSTINEQQGYVTGVNSTLIQQTMTDYQTQVQNHISQYYPNATVGDVLGKKEIIKQEFPYLLGTLPYKTIVKGMTYSSLPDSLRHKLNFNVTKDIFDSELGTPINITKSMPELAGKKLTLSYSPATPADEQVINSYLPKSHADGTPIQPNELPSSLPAYLISLKPELRIDGQVVATGSPIVMGNKETFMMTFSGPGANASDVITNDITAGQYEGIGLDLGRVSQDQMTALKTKLEATKAKLEAQDFSNMTKDDILGDLLYTTALSYHAELGVMKYVSAKTMGVVEITYPSETIFASELKVNTFFGTPLSVSPGGLSMDADRLISLVKALDGSKDKPIQFMLISGMNSSALEHSVPEQLFSTPGNPAQGISAVKALQIANDQGIPIYTINQSNIDNILPQLQLDNGTITDIQNAVNAGKEVTVSKTDVTYNGWTGCGFIIIDPTTGAGAYMISGGMNGAILLICPLFQFLMAAILLIALATAQMIIYLLISLVALLLIIIASFLIFYGPFIAQFMLISKLCGADASKEFLGCVLKVVAVDEGISKILGWAEKVGYMSKLVAKNTEIGVIIFGGIKYLVCATELVMSCNPD